MIFLFFINKLKKTILFYIIINFHQVYLFSDYLRFILFQNNLLIT